MISKYKQKLTEQQGQHKFFNRFCENNLCLIYVKNIWFKVFSYINKLKDKIKLVIKFKKFSCFFVCTTLLNLRKTKIVVIDFATKVYLKQGFKSGGDFSKRRD